MKSILPEPRRLVSDRPGVRVLRDLKTWIAEGVLPLGEPIPAEQVLAEQLRANRGTVRNALRVLLDEGLIEGNGHRRVVVGAPAKSAAVAQPIVQEGSPSLMRNTIVIVSGYDVRQVNGYRSAGWSQVIDQGIINASRSAGLHCLSLHTSALETGEWNEIIAAKPRGVLITDTFGSALSARKALELRRAHVPVVVYGDDPVFDDFDTVRSDQEAGAFELTNWLIKRGNLRILQTGPSEVVPSWFHARRAGYERAMRESELEVLPLVDVGHLPQGTPMETRVRISAELAGILLQPYWAAADAIMAVSDGDLVQLGIACEQNGRIPNQDIALVGYDNFWSEIPEMSVASYPPLATVDKNNEALGVEMLKLLNQRLNGGLPTIPQHRVIKPTLYIVSPGT